MSRARRKTLWIALPALTAFSCVSIAAEFRAIESPAILYDAPSAKARKLYVMGRGYPVEVIVTVEGWVKIRDASGELAWVETKNLTERRTLMVKARIADIRQAPEENARIAFQAEQNVLLDLVELTGTGWARVAHRDGQTGYVRLSQVWGT